MIEGSEGREGMQALARGCHCIPINVRGECEHKAESSGTHPPTSVVMRDQHRSIDVDQLAQWHRADNKGGTASLFGLGGRRELAINGRRVVTSRADGLGPRTRLSHIWSQ